ncbi:hypothetical protein XENORESO_011743 [Xenotaenia resolanae]|uniref:Uncharacterized protein n=1 Tax=Xenotaenia resolanae TaxID=208358 RepID=A0ABV0W900_9TELE
MLCNCSECGIMYPSTVLTVGVLISVTPMAPHLLHYLKSAGTSSEREWSISWSLHTGACHPFRLKLSVTSGTGNGTKHTMFPEPWMLAFNRFSHNAFPQKGY